ncbi:MAG: metallophosphoesterase [Atopobiaceae bacterium]|nr:metallophosphoesterase [Atopobiaceae bacterium]
MPRGTTRLDGGVSRRSFLKLSIAMGGAAAIAASAPETARAAEDGATYPEKLTFAVMSDVHLFSPDLWSDCPDYTTAENSDRKMFRESSDILDKALADVVAAKPDMVLVPGDLTKDGERVCHEWVRDRFAAARQQLVAAGADTQFYVINGNHDLNNHHGRDFSDGSSVDAERTDPLTYKSLWAECGYTDTVVYDAGGTADGSLSYVAHPCPGLTLIAVDTCKYNVAADDGTLAQKTSGHVSADLLAWV